MNHLEFTSFSDLLFFDGQRKVTKETRPGDAESSSGLTVSVAWAKTRFI
ncbi:MAG: hypothetical protein WA081_20155 [Desulfosalsimonadaceae bacterium]